MTDITKKFLEKTYSTNQAKKRLVSLRDYFENKFFISGSIVEKDPWITSLGDDFLKGFNKINAQKNLSDLEKNLEKIPKLTIFVSFEVPEDEIDKIGAALRKDFKLLLIDMKIDPTLIAGAALSWKGMYKDFSLKQNIEENKERILSNFKSYLK